MILVKPIDIKEADLFFDLEEQIWPEDIQATKNQLIQRLNKFPNGVIGCWLNNSPVGYAACQIINYDPKNKVDTLIDFLPRRGILTFKHDNSGNCLFLIAGGILPQYRRKGLWNLLVNYRIALAKNLNLDYVLVDTRIPFYECRDKIFQDLLPKEYATTFINGNYLDPYVNFFYKLNFKIIDVIPSSYKDFNSGNHWVFMLKELNY